jgi:sugar lactone lactonase YvrE
MNRFLLSLLIATLTTHTLHAQVEVVAGSPGTPVIREPFSVAFDSGKVLYGVEFTKSNRIFRVVGGKVEFIAGREHNSEGAGKKFTTEIHDGDDPKKAVFDGMHDIQITSEGIAIIADSFHHRVRGMDLKTGRVSTLAGSGKPGFGGDGGPATKADFQITMTACLSPDEKRIYIADIGNHRTRMVDLNSGLVSTVAGNGKKGLPKDGAMAVEAAMGDTRAVTQASDGTLFVLLRGGNALVAVKDGKVRTVVNSSGKKGYSGDGGPALAATMNGPKYVAMDPQGRVLIADAENHCIRRYDPASETIVRIAGIPPKSGDAIGDDLLTTGLKRPHGVRIGPDGRIYICDTYNDRVLRADYGD